MKIICFHSLMCMSGAVISVGYHKPIYPMTIYLMTYMKATAAKLRDVQGESLMKAPQTP